MDELTGKAWGHALAVTLIQENIKRLIGELNAEVDQAAANRQINSGAVHRTLTELAQYHNALGKHYETQAAAWDPGVKRASVADLLEERGIRVR